MSRFYIGLLVIASILILGIFAGCHKIVEISGKPLPDWEDFSEDSVTLLVRVQDQVGLLVCGQYVNLALSQDSLNRSVLVRQEMTNGIGTVKFRRLYSGVYYLNCFSVSSTSTGYATTSVTLFPQQIKEVVLILQ